MTPENLCPDHELYTSDVLSRLNHNQATKNLFEFYTQANDTTNYYINATYTSQANHMKVF